MHSSSVASPSSLPEHDDEQEALAGVGEKKSILDELVVGFDEYKHSKAPMPVLVVFDHDLFSPATRPAIREREPHPMDGGHDQIRRSRPEGGRTEGFAGPCS